MRAGGCSAGYTAFGVRFRLRAERGEMLNAMRARVPYGAEQCAAAGSGSEFALLGTGEDGYRLIEGSHVAGESAQPCVLLDQLGRDLMVHVANCAPDLVFVHAGVVGWRGRALLLPGSSFAGKTTLVAALVRLGALYYSDEYAVVDRCGLVHPYARDLQAREEGRVEQVPLTAAELDGATGEAPLAVSHVIFAEYAVGARWKPGSVSAGEAVLEMMRHAIAVQRTPGRVMATLATMMERASALRGLRGEASETARALLSALDGTGEAA